jgi:hypothetical protein
MNVGTGCLAVLIAIILGIGALLFVAHSESAAEVTAAPAMMASPAP